MPKELVTQGPVQRLIPRAGALVSLLPRLSGWQPQYGSLANYETVAEALIEAERLLIPAGVKAVTVMLDSALALWGTPENWEQTAQFYFEVFEDVPEDLVMVSMKRVRFKHNWNFMPKPADFRSEVGAEMRQRTMAVVRLKAMLPISKRETGIEIQSSGPTEEEKKRVKKIVADMAKRVALDNPLGPEQRPRPRYLDVTNKMRDKAFENLRRMRI